MVGPHRGRVRWAMELRQNGVRLLHRQAVRRKSVAVLGYVVTALGTAAIGLATTAWHVLLARAAAWLRRGVRLRCERPCSLLRSRARHMDVRSASNVCWTPSARLSVQSPHYGCWMFLIITIPACSLSRSCLACLPLVLFCFLLPKSSALPSHAFLWRTPADAARRLPSLSCCRRLVGAGDSNTLLILLAAQKLTPMLGATEAASIAVALYVLHNVFYPRSLLFPGGWPNDSARTLCSPPATHWPL